MASNSRTVETVLARNLLSSVLALAYPSDLNTNAAALETFLCQQATVCEALERHNVFGLVTDGKAVSKWQTRLIELLEGSSKTSRLGWELMLTTVRQSPLERLEALAVDLLERAVKALKRLQSSKTADEDTELAAGAICGVVRALLLHVEKYNSDTRREALELLAKLLQSLVALLSSKRRTKNESMALAQWELIATLLCVAPNSMKSFAIKVESACVSVLFSTVDGKTTNEKETQKASMCLALLCNASDKPQQVWTQVAQKALEAAHQQLDLIAGKRATTASTEERMGSKLWVLKPINQQWPVYQRANVTLNRMNHALSALHELLSVRTGTQSRGLISEREVQQVLPDIILFARRAMGVRALEVGKHTGVSDDGVRLPLSVVYAVLPRVHVLALRVLSASVERSGICALRHASKITRVLLLASESVGDGEDLQALADATAVCARRLGASTVEKFGVFLLNVLVSRCKRSLDEKTRTQYTSDSVALALSAQQNDSKNSGHKSKKRKRQAAAAATLAALNSGNAAAKTRFVSLRDEMVTLLTLDAVLTAIAGCVSVYGSLLPHECRSSTSELILKAVQRRRVTSCHAHSVADPVALALMSDAMTADSMSSHGANLLCGLRYWQRRSFGSGGTSSILQLVALNAGEAMLHPRAPPLTITFQQSLNNKQENQHVGANVKLTKKYTIQGDAMDWDEHEPKDSDDEDDKAEPVIITHAKSEARPVTEGEEEEQEEEEVEDNYEDARPLVAPMEVFNEEVDDEEDEGEIDESAMQCISEKPIAMIEADDDDDFPEIVVDDD